MTPLSDSRTLGPRPLVGAAALAAALLAPLACGGGGDAGGDAPDASDGAAPAAETGPAGAAAPADGGEEDHEPDGRDGHAHGSGTHTHAAADTLVAGRVLDPGPAAGWTGSATLLSVGDSVRVLVSVEGSEAEARHRAELAAGSCETPGPTLATLPPVAAGASGAGSSQATVPPEALGDRSHGALRLGASDGAASACAEVHLAGEHTHED